MAKKYQHWYIRGWSYEEVVCRNGAKKRELMYQGEYYRPNLSTARFRNLKIIYTFFLVVIYATYVWFSMSEAAGGREAYAGAGCILSIIPLIFQGMGVVSLWTTPHKMPFRHYYGGVLRTKVSSAATAALLLFSAVGQTIFMVLHRKTQGIHWINEWIWLIGCLVCGLLSFTMFYFLQVLHFDILPGQVDTSSACRRTK